ncbi:TonB-dependent receptor domain-containing protein [Qipengyuania sp.]|uniref:TonB-dependent receptor domain-containing protein n=1 Tax=Qipengyuania sp. TaxID=2004515 RepID=UPI0035C7F919
MFKTALLLSAATIFAYPAYAENDLLSQTSDANQAAADEAPEVATPRPTKQAFNTGVARARDPLDTAVSTSTLIETQITQVAPRSMAEIFRSIPGIRSEAAAGDINNSYTVRGLPLVSDGSKYIQLQENGLPVLEFGDLFQATPDNFMRVDINLAGIQTIRGGSASTFASNAPGGIINLIEKTGDVEGGSIQFSSGLNYDLYRVDADYGVKLDDTLRMHIGGYYRTGEGARNVGSDSAYEGGQIKANLTKDFAGGYVRLYGKYLDEQVPQYYVVPLRVSGTNSDPVYESLSAFSATEDTLHARNITTLPFLDKQDRVQAGSANDFTQVSAKSIGLEGKIDLSGWSIIEKFRYADMSISANTLASTRILPAAFVAFNYGGPGAVLSYATGPNAGTVIANPNTLNGNGLISYTVATDFKFDDLNNLTNDLRASRVWDLSGGKLTFTAGYYHSEQGLGSDWRWLGVLQDVVGNAESALVNIRTAAGMPITQGGVISFNVAGYNRATDLDYTVDAPYGSLNFQKGRLALGGSIRYDIGKVRGTAQIDRPADVGFIDVDGNGVPSSYAETVAIRAANRAADPVDYDYDYLSYSLSANFHMLPDFSLFARYSVGGRAAADRILYSAAIDTSDGSLADEGAAYDEVRQLEGGFKFRKPNALFNVTGFLANVDETNTQIVRGADGIPSIRLLQRKYKAYGAELEGKYTRGIFTVNAGATITGAEITADRFEPALIGNKPRHQATLIYSVTPQIDTDLFSVGTQIIGTTGSYAQDNNKLRLPAYTTVGAFIQVRPVNNIVLSLNGSNLFDELAITETIDGTIPVTGVVAARTLYGRTISASLRFNF